MATTHRRRIQLQVEPGFDLRLVLFSHGWIDLAPHSWDSRTRALATAFLVGRQAVDLTLRHHDGRLTGTVSSLKKIGDDRVVSARSIVGRMLGLGEGLEEFWALCRKHPELSWVARRRAGRMLRCATLFEDLMKLLFTTNCSWAATRKMNERLVAALGERTTSGRRTFPTPQACAAAGEAFFRKEVRAGYRAGACQELAEKFASGTLRAKDLDHPDLPTEEVRRRLHGLRGFGPYAVGQALRLLGRHQDLALDSWCRSKLQKMQGRHKAPTDVAIARRYASFGNYRGLALWMDLTADWHGERP